MPPSSPTKQLRGAIVHLRIAGKSVAEICHALNCTRILVYRTWTRYQESQSTNDRFRSGRPHSVRTPRFKVAVRGRIHRNPERSMRQMARDLHVSESSMRRLITKDMRLKSLRKRHVHSLNTIQRQKRKTRARKLLCKGRRVGWDRIWWSDEKMFACNQVWNKQNTRLIASSVKALDPEHRFVQKKQGGPKVMVWIAFSSHTKSRIIAIPSGSKMNSEVYQEQILEKEVRRAGTKYFNGRPWLYQQDGAPSHTSRSSIEWLSQNNIPFIAPNEWPPSSPNLNPADFCLWGLMENEINKIGHSSEASLLKAITAAWKKFPQEVLPNACEAVPRRLREVIKADGGYIGK